VRGGREATERGEKVGTERTRSFLIIYTHSKTQEKKKDENLF